MTDTTLKDFRATSAGLTSAECAAIADQAVLFLKVIHAHRNGEAKTRIENAISRLTNLIKKCGKGQVAERDFHDEMLHALKSIKDRHTHYLLPRPFREQVAFLPFVAADYYEGDERRYLVTQVQTSSAGEIQPGDRITHWNGEPIAQVVARLAASEDGARAEASEARALFALTVRPTWLLPLPEEDIVMLRVEGEEGAREGRFEWRVRGGAKAAPDAGLFSGSDALMETIHRFRDEFLAAESLAKAATASLPERLAQAGVAYLRLRDFGDGEDAFIDAISKALDPPPANGFVIDVRGNPGGYIPAGEAIVQLLSPREIEPVRWFFQTSPETLALSETLSETTSYPEEVRNQFAAYLPSLRRSLEVGTPCSHAFPITPPLKANAVGQIYDGPVLLLTDALTYSVGDLFSAAVQDHGIGEILGSGEATGGGGSNDLASELFVRLMPAAFQKLPQGAAFRISTRACFRMGEHVGTLIERLGVVSDHMHRPTKTDRLDGDPELAARAIELLRNQEAGTSLAVDRIDWIEGQVKTTVTTKGLSRIDLAIDDRPVGSADVVDGQQSFDAPYSGSQPASAEFRGFRGSALRFRRRVPIGSS